MRTRAFAGLIALPLAFGLPGCVDNQAFIEFANLCFPQPATAANTCPASSNTCTTIVGEGRLFVDIGVVGELIQQIQINNQLPDNADATTGRVNTNDALIEEFRFTYSTAGASIPSTSSPQTVLVPAANSQSPFVIVMPPGIIAVLSALSTPREVVVNVSAAGHLKDGSTFVAGPYPIPVDVCSGCAGVTTCPQAGQLPTYCPQFGQTASVACF
jgi:hypothetical protein